MEKTPQRTLIGELDEHVDQQVRVAGFIDTIRAQKNVQFVVIRDRSGSAQVTHVRGKGSADVEKAIDGLTLGSAVVVAGQLVQNKQVKLGGLELIADSLDVVGKAETPLPIDEKSGSDARLDWRYLDLRQPKNQLAFAVETTIEQAMREFWQQEKFIEIHTPKLMGSPSETRAELFELEYFDKTAYLAQSPQFFKQMAMAAGFDRIFEVGPVFRADPSYTTRHTTEYTSVDMEFSWIDSHEDVMVMEERWLAHVLKRVADVHGAAIKEAFGVEVVVPKLPFPRLTMADAQAVLKKTGHKTPKPGDLDPEGERIISKHIAAERKHEFVFVTDYPAKVRAFYHMRYADKPELTKSFDLLWKGVEITTGAQREHRLEVLKAQALEKKMRLEPIQFYLNFFRYGCPPHGGIGFGLSRMLMLLLGLPSVREAQFLFRGPNRLIP